MVRRTNLAALPEGTRTITVLNTQPHDERADPEVPTVLIPREGAIRLTGGPRSRPQVTWDEHVIDNENCGKKKSKICCIYHKPRPFDESSSEEDSSGSESDSPDSDSDTQASDDGRARPPQCHRRHHHHALNSSDSSGSGCESPTQADPGVYEYKNEKPNAYEAQPSHSRKGKGRAKHG